MKKKIILIFFIFCAYFGIGKVIESKNLIPEDAIRMRVVPNSNDERDQTVKMKVKEKLESDVFASLKDVKGIKEARQQIQSHLPLFEKSISDVLEKENYTLGYQLHFGMNYFPEKVYKGITYEEGEYESLVVTLGEGKGDNWWCVLFPPLCLIEAEESDEVEYKLWIEELIDKYM